MIFAEVSVSSTQVVLSRLVNVGGALAGVTLTVTVFKSEVAIPETTTSSKKTCATSAASVDWFTKAPNCNSCVPAPKVT